MGPAERFCRFVVCAGAQGQFIAALGHMKLAHAPMFQSPYRRRHSATTVKAGTYGGAVSNCQRPGVE